jgi:hypothetical protein
VPCAHRAAFSCDLYRQLARRKGNQSLTAGPSDTVWGTRHRHMRGFGGRRIALVHNSSRELSASQKSLRCLLTVLVSLLSSWCAVNLFPYPIY